MTSVALSRLGGKRVILRVWPITSRIWIRAGNINRILVWPYLYHAHHIISYIVYRYEVCEFDVYIRYTYIRYILYIYIYIYIYVCVCVYVTQRASARWIVMCMYPARSFDLHHGCTHIHTLDLQCAECRLRALDGD